MELEEAKIWIEQQEFVVAKSYEKTFPHFYTTRDRCEFYMFELFLHCIRKHGKVKSFYRKQYVYLELGGFEYWEMGRPIPAVQVLNKAKINDNAKYRIPTPTEEQSEILKAKLNEREKELFRINQKEIKTEKDFAIIDFLMNTERRIHGGGKNIIDDYKINVKYE